MFERVTDTIYRVPTIVIWAVGLWDYKHVCLMFFRIPLLISAVCMILSGCARDQAGAPTDGRQLAQSYCSNCHIFPEPELLSRDQWRQVLPYMGHRLGKYDSTSRDTLIAHTDLQGIDTTALFPEAPALSDAQWQAVQRYFLETAPLELPVTIAKRRL